MSICVFCKILSGEFEASFVARGEHCSAFMDINPLAKGHLLVVPNKHIERMKDLDADTATEMFKMANDVHKAMLKAEGLEFSGANFFLSDGCDAGQEVGHLHIHIAPRNADDGIRIAAGKHHSSERQSLDALAANIGAHL